MIDCRVGCIEKTVEVLLVQKSVQVQTHAKYLMTIHVTSFVIKQFWACVASHVFRGFFWFMTTICNYNMELFHFASEWRVSFVVFCIQVYHSQLFDKEWHVLFNLDNMEQRIFYFFEASISLLKYRWEGAKLIWCKSQNCRYKYPYSYTSK